MNKDCNLIVKKIDYPRIKVILIFVALLFISFIATLKSYWFYQAFHSSHLPVYDGVMNEKSQIMSFVRFNGNYSFIERMNQMIYEFRGNPLSAGFGAIIAMINPNWFVNDWDIYIRSFLSVFILCHAAYVLLSARVKPLNIIISLLLFFQIPIFYNYRIGLVSYVPEIPATLILIAGFIYLIHYFSSRKKVYYFLGLFLMFFSLIFRFNFFVYILCLLPPFILPFFGELKNETTKNKLISIGFLFVLLLLLGIYVREHFEFFIGYYLKPVEYQSKSLYTTFASLFNFATNYLGWITLLIFSAILVFLDYGRINNSTIKLQKVLIYPFLFFFLFIFILLKSHNQPHIQAALVIMFIPVLFYPLRFKWIKYQWMNNVFYFTCISIFSISTLKYINDLELLKVVEDKDKVNLLVAKEIEKHCSDKNFSYLCFHEEALDVPIDVFCFKKQGKMFSNHRHFYFNDWNYYDMDKDLNIANLYKYYKYILTHEKPKIVVINKSYFKDLRNYKVATKLNRMIYNELILSNEYKLEKWFFSLHYGRLQLFTLKSASE
jgi:hypothetical protein